MVSLAARQLWKRTLSILRVKLLYSRITLTRFTTFYFFLAFASCIVLSALQGVAFTDNSMAVAALAPVVKNVPSDQVLVLEKGVLQTCTSIPDQRGTKCTVHLVFGSRKSKRHWDDDGDILDIEEAGNGDGDTDGLRNGSPVKSASSVLTNDSGLSDNCILSMAWLDETLEDSKREDIVTFLFQIWLFSLALVTILNESIPHLGAAFFGHVLGTGWAGYRVSSSQALTSFYRRHIVPEACGGKDLLGGWWDIRIQHAVPIVIVNSVVLLALLYVSARLYKVYATESFSRVGASPVIHGVYKTVLLFSVGLQLSGFFSLASSAMWIDKVCHGMMKMMALHSKLYLAAFVIILVFQFPMLYLGWVCVRKECRIRFGIFCAISIFLLSISTLMFFSPLYRYIFMTWPFFATVTVTAYVLTVFTSVLAIVCRLNFGKGLAHYLQVTDALEGVDFTPVSFWKGHGYGGDTEKMDLYGKAKQGGQGDASGTRLGDITLQLPAMAHRHQHQQDESHMYTHTQPRARARAHARAESNGRPRVQDRGSSIYSDEGAGTPVMLSFSPPLISEMAPAPTRLAKVAVSRARRSGSLGGGYGHGFGFGHGHGKSQSLSQSLGGSVLGDVPYPPPGLDMREGVGVRSGWDDEGSEEEGVRGGYGRNEASRVQARGDTSPSSTSNPTSPSSQSKGTQGAEAAAAPVGQGDILTRVPKRSSSIQSRASARSRSRSGGGAGKLVKQGLPANPRARAGAI
uniref:Uncharacterized protein n=1 Tax=Psilocybe cubensis TaxID=181762 RepID=A0A8H8CEP1_PSICU